MGGGICIQGGWADTPPPKSDSTEYGQRAGGAHPTGMHSCSCKYETGEVFISYDMGNTYTLQCFGMTCLSQGQVRSRITFHSLVNNMKINWTVTLIHSYFFL